MVLNYLPTYYLHHTICYTPYFTALKQGASLGNFLFLSLNFFFFTVVLPPQYLPPPLPQLSKNNLEGCLRDIERLGGEQNTVFHVLGYGSWKFIVTGEGEILSCLIIPFYSLAEEREDMISYPLRWSMRV